MLATDLGKVISRKIIPRQDDISRNVVGSNYDARKKFSLLKCPLTIILLMNYFIKNVRDESCVNSFVCVCGSLNLN